MPRIAAICCSILCCVSLVWAMRSEHHTPWRAYQRQYIEGLHVKIGTSVSTPGILEVRTETYGVRRTDRCMTCHQALADTRFAGGQQPLSYHPPVEGHADVTATACTLCHQGNGRMLTATGAHGINPPAAEPRLELRYIQASCPRCHEAKDADRIAPKAAVGRRRFLTDSCFGCHTIDGLSRGSVGPDLTDVARRRLPKDLRAILIEPTTKNSHSPMPPISTDRPEDLDSLVTFLLTLRGARQPYVYQK